MVLYYGLFALEAANNSIAAAAAATRSTSNIPKIASDRLSLSRKQKNSSNSISKMPSSSLSSSNSWIYTEDLRKRFEERYADYRYVFVPVYIDRKSPRHSHSTTGIIPPKLDRENSWMYSRSLRDHLFYSTSKISIPLTTNMSSSACCVTNHGFMRDELPVTKKDLKSRLFKRASSVKEKTTTNMSLSSSMSSFSTTNNLVKHRTSDVVEEEDDEGVENENHSIPLIKHDSMVPSTSRTAVVSSTDNNANVNPATTSELADRTSALSKTTSSMKHTTTRNKKLTRLRSFFFRTSSPSSSRVQQQPTTLSNQISRT